ncbi:MAG: LamG domain-containing protein, partial [Pseudomonadota bacterium]
MMVKLRCRLRTVLLIAIGLSWFSGAMADLNDGLVAYYPFDGNAKDASGNGNHGTVHGATLTKDRFGNTVNAYTFDGINDNIQTVNTFGDNAAQISVVLWLKANSLNTSWSGVIGRDRGGVNTDDVWNVLLADDEIRVEVAETGNKEFSLSHKIDTSWHSVGMVYNGSTQTFKMYFDGNLVNQVATEVGVLGSTPSLKLTIGSYSNNTYMFNGSIDDIRIYNRAISESEIKQLYQGCQPSIDIKLNSNNRVTGDKVVINAQIKGPGSSDSSCEQTKVEQKVWVKLPNDSVIPLIDPFTVLTLLPGDDIDTKIFEYVFSGAE